MAFIKIQLRKKVFSWWVNRRMNSFLFCFPKQFDYSQHTTQTTCSPCICCVLAKNAIIFSATSDLTFYETYFVDLWVVRFSKEGHLLRESWMRMHNDSYFVTPTSISKKKEKNKTKSGILLSIGALYYNVPS